MKRIVTAAGYFLVFYLYLCSGNIYANTRIALVIGNGSYPDNPLRNPVNDANLIAKTLEELDFQVVKHLDSDQQTMKKAIRDFGDTLEQAGKDAVGLFYYSGHGVQTGGTNYLIPVNARINRESDVEIEAVSASAVLGTLAYARNNLNIVILDACRNNPFARSFRSASRGLAKLDRAPPETVIAFATAPSTVAADGDGQNSPYTLALTAAMLKPNLAVEQMFKIVRREVMAQTDNKQVPWENSSLTGDFYFSPGQGQDSVAPIFPTAITQSDIDKEALFWGSIKDSENFEDYQEYLRQFPAGVFVALASRRIAEFTGVQTQPVSQPVAGPTAAESASATLGPTSSAPAIPLTRTVRLSEQEKNNSFGAANPVSANSQIHGRIAPKGDVDWYQIYAPRQGELKIQVSNVAAEMDVVLRVWNAAKSTYSSWISPLSKGAVTEGFVDLKYPGHYTLEVADSHNDASSGQPYFLNLNFTPSMDVYEPNDSFGTAARLSGSQTWWPTIMPKGDVDWYQFRVDWQGELRVMVTEVPEQLDISMRVWNADKSTISSWYSPLKKGGDTEMVFDLPTAGVYTLEMADGRSDARSNNRFRVDMRFRPSVDRAEPNNSYGSASILAIGEPVKVTHLPANDNDWYRIHVDEQGQLDVNITDVPSNLDIFYRIWNSEKSTISGWTGPLKEGGDTIGSFDLAKAGDYFLEVADSKHDNRSIEPYTIRLGFIPSRDRSEANDSFSQASPLKIGSTITGAILPKGDSDWYRISAAWPGDLKVHLSNVPENLDLSARLWNSEKSTVSGWLSPLKAGGDTEGTVPINGAGTYFLEVRDGSNDQRSTQHYTLSISM